MGTLFYMYALALALFVALVISYRIGASSLRSELQRMSPEVEAVVFPQNSQPSFSFYSAIPLKVLFRPSSISPPLPRSVIGRLLSLSRMAGAAAIAALLSFMLLAVLLVRVQA